ACTGARKPASSVHLTSRARPLMPGVRSCVLEARKLFMDRRGAIQLLRDGPNSIEEWNNWRLHHSGDPNLSHADFRGAVLTNANFERADCDTDTKWPYDFDPRKVRIRPSFPNRPSSDIGMHRSAQASFIGYT